MPWTRAWASAGAGAQDAAARYDRGLLWRLARAGARDSHAFGTIHIADARVADPPAAVLDALAASRSYAMELVAEEVVRDRLFELEELRGGQRLEPLVGSEVYGRVHRVLSEQGVPAHTIERMKPWAAMMVAARQEARDASHALDRRLLAAARARRLRIQSLEHLEEQIASFDTVPLATQVALLRHVLDDRDALEGETEATIQAWLAGDLAELARYPERMERRFPGMGPHYRELVRHLVHNRTVLMHHRLTLPLRTGAVFVAIGALHLQGANGLLAMLAADGYRVERIR